jgi:lysophospholipase L1-like esterase
MLNSSVRKGTLSRGKHVAFSLIALLLVLGGAELAIRLHDFAKGAGAQARSAWYWGYTQDRFLSYRARSNINIVFEGGKNHLDTNSDGFRDQEFDPRRLEGKRVIICIGESSTWGTGSTTRAATWPHQLSELLSARDPRLVVLNAGIPGYTMVENLQLVNLRLLKYHPEAIIYMGFRNDVEYYAASLADKVDLNLYPRTVAFIPSTWINELAMRSALVSTAVTMLGGLMHLDSLGVSIPAAGTHLTDRGKATMRDQIALMQTLCARHGIKLLWVDQPINYSQVTNRTALEEGRDVLHEEAERNAVPMLEAHTLYDQAQYPLVDDVHFTDSGNRHLAEILAPQVLSNLAPSPPQ